MYQKLTRVLKKLHRGQKGMTGLETAIILIAFVTVASVLAYSVLSAGIFSAEKGKATVYGGLAQASSSIGIKGPVIGDATASSNVSLDYIYFLVSLTIPDESLDMSSLAVNVYSKVTHAISTNEGWDGTPTPGYWQYQKVPDSTERGSTDMLEGDEVFEIVVDTSSFDTISAYEWFVVEIVSPAGATINIKRTMPSNLRIKMNLN